MSTRVVITGLGAVTPLGNDVPSLWAALREGRSGVGPITRFDPSGLTTQFAAEVKDFDANMLFGRREARRMDRYMQYAVFAAGQALEDAKLTVDDSNCEDIGAIIGSGVGGMGTLVEQVEVFRERGPRRLSAFLVPMMLPDSAAGQVAISFGLKGPNMAVVSACATGNNAIGEAYKMIQRGAMRAALAGGSDAGIIPIAIAAFNVVRAISTRNDNPQAASRPFDAERDGFVLGEGAGVVLLESLEHAQARGAHIYSEVTGYGSSADACHITAPAEGGAGAAQAMRAALADAGLTPDDVDYINAHGTSTPLNDAAETAAIKTVFGPRAYAVPISSTKSMTGHMFGAGGAVEAIACADILTTGLIHPTINYEHPDPACDLDYVPNVARQANPRTILSNAFGFGGHNACLVFRKYEA